MDILVVLGFQRGGEAVIGVLYLYNFRRYSWLVMILILMLLVSVVKSDWFSFRL